MKKVMFLLSAVFIALMTVTSGCSLYDTNTQTARDAENTELTQHTDDAASTIFLTFPKAVELSDCAAVAEFIEYTDKQDYVEYVFALKEALRGEFTDNTVHVVSSRDTATAEEETGKDVYTAGEDYILIMGVTDSIFTDYPQYTLFADIFIPAGNIDNGTMYGELISGSYEGDIITLIRETEIKTEKSYTKFSGSEDMEVIIEEADLVLEVRITSLLAEGLFNGSPYYCEVLDIIKGDKISKTDNDEVIITLMKGSVEIGESYLVMVNRSSENSVVFTQSSLKSVIPLKDTAAVNEAKAWLAQ